MRNLGLGDLGFLGAVGGVAYDSDALAYMAAVEAADGQALETAVKDAINAFVVGCKADGIWTAIKASCILAGARTLSGALVPLVGTAPTNFNFVASDYNRKTGLVGDGSVKYLNSNRNNNADPQNNQHLSLYNTNTGSPYMGAGVATNEAGVSNFGYVTGSRYFTRSRNGVTREFFESYSAGFYGISRSNSTSYTARYKGSSNTITIDSQSPYNGIIYVNGNPSTGLTSSFAFYSIGESLDLAKLDSRVTTLINAFGTAIP